MSAISHRLTDLGYAAGWSLARMLPSGLTGSAFAVGADLALRKDGEGVRQLRHNLSRVIPQAEDAELDELVRRSLRSYARYWHEVFRLPSMDLAKVRNKVDEAITGVAHLDAALADGNGAVLVLPHSGNWDSAGIWLVEHAGTFTTVVERLRPESLFNRFVSYRESLGFEVLPETGASGSFRSLLRRLRAGGAVCLIGDRDLSASGIPVTFFGEQVSFPGGPARLAASTGAALLPVGCWFNDDGWTIRIHPRVRVNARAEVPAATQQVADVFAGDIAAHPADWHMLQPFWTADRLVDSPVGLGEVGR